MCYTGTVLRSTGSWYDVAVQKDGESDTIQCRLPGRFRLEEQEVTNPIAAGDKVDISLNEDGTGTIQSIHKRKNYITRKATHGRRGEQILAANIDRAWCVQSVKKPKLKTGFIDRFLVTCEAYEVPGGLIINKTDLIRSNSKEYIRYVANMYENLGYPVLCTSIHNDSSLRELAAQLQNLTSVLIGPSGVGKTSLLNAIDSSLDLRVGEISSYSQKGKHTTTYAEMIELSCGGYILDTPGIREFGLVNISKSELYLYFPEMIEPAQHCKYYNCTHSHEPNCGVVQAFEEGKIEASRYDSYLKILESLED